VVARFLRKREYELGISTIIDQQPSLTQLFLGVAMRAENTSPPRILLGPRVGPLFFFKKRLFFLFFFNFYDKTFNV